MVSVSGRQKNLLRTQLSLVSQLGRLLDPLVAQCTLAATIAYFDEPFSAPYLVLSVIVFSLTFPAASRLDSGFRMIARGVVISWGGLAALLLAFGYASGYMMAFPSEVLTAWLVGTPVAMILANAAARRLVLVFLASERHQRTAVIVGFNDIGQRLAREIRTNPTLGLRVVGFFDDRGHERLGGAIGGDTLLGNIAELSGYGKTHRIDLIYLALPMVSQPRILRLLDDLRDTTTSIYFVPDFFMTDLIQGRLDEVGTLPVVALCETPFIGINGLIKRASDIILSFIILLLISPLMLCIAAGVKLGSPGPAIFRQRRYGLDGKEIVVFKFRSMTVCEDGEQIAQATREDHRVTPFGAFLRRTSLDELPQFLNVLQGSMSVVGPRPHAIAHNEMYRKLIKGYMIRHKVKPGITGLAQVRGLRGETDAIEKMKARIECDLDYLRNWSLGLDLAIVLKTPVMMLNDRNAY